MRQRSTGRARMLFGAVAGLAALAACGGDRSAGGAADTAAATGATALSASVVLSVDGLNEPDTGGKHPRGDRRGKDTSGVR